MIRLSITLLVRVLAAHYGSVRDPDLNSNHSLAILSELNDGGNGKVYEAIGTLLSDADVGDEDEVKAICNKMEELMFGSVRGMEV